MCSPGAAELPPDKMLRAQYTWVRNIIIIVLVFVLVIILLILIIVFMVMRGSKHLKMFPPAPAFVAEHKPIRHCSHTCDFTDILVLVIISKVVIIVVIPPLT